DRARESGGVAEQRRDPFMFTPLFEKSSYGPTPLSGPEQRAQVYLALIGGVRGIFWWEWPASYAGNWEMIRQLVKEMTALKPVLFPVPPAQELVWAQPATQKIVTAL